MTIDKNLIQRTLAGLVFLAVMIFCICWNSYTLAGLMVVLSALASYEMVQLVSTKTVAQKHKILSVSLAVLAGLFCSLLLLDFYQFYQLGVVLFIFPFLALMLLFILPDSIENRLAKTGTFVFTLFYIVASFMLMQMLAGGRGYIYYSFNHLLALFILVWSNDTMAYVCGRLLGKHKLAPELSPKKTWEGFAGGMVFTVIASFIIHYCMDWRMDHKVWLIPVAVSISATIGDLFESAIKRWAGVKDSGNLIPGHGGILDRFDGAIFAVWPYFFIVQFV